MGLFGKKAEAGDESILASVIFLEKLSSHERRMFAQQLDRRTFDAGEWVFHQGYPQAVMYIVAEGEIDIVLETPGREPQVVDTLGPGSFFGETGLFIESERTAGVRAKTPAVLLAVSQHDFHHFVHLNPRAGAKLLYGLGQRLSSVLLRSNQQRADESAENESE